MDKKKATWKIADYILPSLSFVLAAINVVLAFFVWKNGGAAWVGNLIGASFFTFLGLKHIECTELRIANENWKNGFDSIKEFYYQDLPESLQRKFLVHLEWLEEAQ